MAKYVLSVDQSTQGTKALIFDEAGKILASDYLVSTLVSGDWANQVTFDGDTTGLADGVPLRVSITTERIAPISLILGGNA